MSTAAMVTNPAITGIRGSTVQLRAQAGRAVLVGAPGHTESAPESLDLPPTLIEALHEWAGVAERVREGGRVDEQAARMVSRRGLQLAVRLAAETGHETDYLDPVSGRSDRVTGQRQNHEPESRRTQARSEPRGGTAPTPWATGLTVSGIIAAIVVVSLVVVSEGLAEVNAFLAVVVNVAVAAGFAPSIWMGRRVPVWRWVAFGTAGGIGLAWFALLLSLLG